MPDPTPTDRDRELAHRALDNSPIQSLGHDQYLILRGQVEAITTQARSEGREEGIMEALHSVMQHRDSPVGRLAASGWRAGMNRAAAVIGGLPVGTQPPEGEKTS